MRGVIHLWCAGALALTGLAACGGGDGGSDAQGPGDTVAATDPGGDPTADPAALPDTSGTGPIEGTRLYYTTTYPDVVLKSVRVDGTDVQTHATLTTPPATPHYFAESPDRRHVLWEKATSAGVWEGYHLIDLDTGTDAFLREGNALYRVWAPDSSRFLISVYPKGYEIVDLTGATVATGIDPGASVDQGQWGTVAWSPDGALIAFYYSDLAGSYQRLVFTDAQFSAFTYGVEEPVYLGFSHLTWPTPTRLVAVSRDNVIVLDDTGHMEATNAVPEGWKLSGSNQIGETETLPLPLPDGQHLLVRVSPDGATTEFHLTSLDFVTEDQTLVTGLRMIPDDEHLVSPGWDALYVREGTSRVVTFDGREFSTFPDDMRSCHVVAWR